MTATTNEEGGSTLKFMITEADKVQLRGLGYDEAEINKMRPEEAADILGRSIKSGSQKESPSLLNYALRALKLGLCVMPAAEDGTKRPLGQSATDGRWKHFQTVPPSEQQVRKWYTGSDLSNIGYITGKVSGNLEVIDFDDTDTYKAYKAAAAASGLGDIVSKIESGYLEYTPHGVHWLYRCSSISGNQKLASRLKSPEEMRDKNDRIKGLIETRGEGGFIIAAPSEGPVNPSGVYRLISGGLTTIAQITPEERQELFRLAHTFDALPRKNEEKAAEPTGDGPRPGELFASKTSWQDILTPHGWKECYTDRQGTTFWTRPGKSQGISACSNYQGCDLFYVWTSSTDFEPERGFNKFSVYTQLNHNGNFSAAARALGSQGFGDIPPGTGPQGANASENTTDSGRKTLFISAPEMLSQTVVLYPLIGKLIEKNSTGQLFGPSNSGKTFVALDMSCAVASGGEWNNHQCEQGLVIYFAGEGNQGLTRRVRAWHQHHGSPDLSNLHFSRSIIPFTVKGLKQVVAEIKELEERTEKHIAFIVIDTLARHIEGDESATKDMSAFIRLIDGLRNAFPGSTALVVHHSGKSTDKADSGRGSGAMKAACEFDIQCDKGRLTYRKLKEGELPDPQGFKLVPVEIGLDEDGEPITSCVVTYGEWVAKGRENRLSTGELELLNLIKATHGILSADLKAALWDKRSKSNPEVKYDTVKHAFDRSLKSLLSKGRVYKDGDLIKEGQGQKEGH